ncbi:MAG: histidine--tRNA ligase [Microbacter sp.]
MMQQPSIPKGTRDFSPEEMAKRNYIFNTIRRVFHLYGFSQIETPAIENLSTLMGKYGEEGDKLLFKILNSGDFASSVEESEWISKNSARITPRIAEKGLRYDLTVPFARYVVQHRDQITFPFKRFQIQPVWRADRPQKGRYREFYQCDADVIGSNSLLNEVELIQLIDEVFHQLQIKVTIKLNHRKILSGIAQLIGAENKITEFTVAIDKIEKIGIDNVNKELESKGIPQTAIKRLQPIFVMQGTLEEKINRLKATLSDAAVDLEGIHELQTVLAWLKPFTLHNQVELDVTLARGLNYYTGMILEVKANDVQIGSICGGGRYDNLTGVFGLHNVSGVGISFGADRIYDVLQQLNAFPETITEKTSVLFLNFGEKEQQVALNLLHLVRQSGINAEIYPEAAKIKKQMNYANQREIDWVVMLGESEMNQHSVKLKNMHSGEEQSVVYEALTATLLKATSIS